MAAQILPIVGPRDDDHADTRDGKEMTKMMTAALHDLDWHWSVAYDLAVTRAELRQAG